MPMYRKVLNFLSYWILGQKSFAQQMVDVSKRQSIDTLSKFYCDAIKNIEDQAYRGLRMYYLCPSEEVSLRTRRGLTPEGAWVVRKLTSIGFRCTHSYDNQSLQIEW